MSDSNSNKVFIFSAPKVIWRWDFFGDGGSFMVTLHKDVSIWKRFWTKVTFGSIWTRVQENGGGL